MVLVANLSIDSIIIDFHAHRNIIGLILSNGC